MSDICDRADTSRTFEKKEVSPYCTRCTLESHGHYPHYHHETNEHGSWLQRMIALFK